MEDALQFLLDRARISDAVMRYFFALDRFDAASVRNAIADQFTLDAGSFATPPEAKPADEFVRELVERNWGFTGTIHINPNHLIELEGDFARVTAYMWASHIVGPEAEDCFWGYGIYEIELARSADDWLLTSLTIRPVRTEGGEPGRIYPIAAQRQASGEGH